MVLGMTVGATTACLVDGIIPAFAGMTEEGVPACAGRTIIPASAGMTVGATTACLVDGIIPAFAGMTRNTGRRHVPAFPPGRNPRAATDS